jgi:phi13 family phage major tail protein
MPPNAAESRSFVGLRDLYYAEVTQDDADGYVAGTPVHFAPAIDASLAAASNARTQYADNQAYDTMSSEGESKITLTVTGLPVETLAFLAGRVFDASTGRMYDNGGTPPYVALGFSALRSNGSTRYYWYLKGRFQMPDEDKASKSDTPDPKALKLTFTAVKTIYQFELSESIDDGVKRVVGDEDTADFDETGWFGAVQTPETTSVSDVSVVSDPLDDAASVAIAKTITLTFNNAIREDSIAGVILVRIDTGLPIACARSLDVTKKILSLDPSSNLTNNKEYFTSVAGVTDIYGQVLADVVYSFTTVAA